MHIAELLHKLRIAENDYKFEHMDAAFEGRECQCLSCRGNDANLMNKLMGVEMGDTVNSPQHYIGHNGLEVIDIIEGFDLNYNLGNVTKYVLRAGKKEDELQDLKKAMWYLRREIKNVEYKDEDEDE